MDPLEIVSLSVDNIKLIAPALLVISSLATADLMIDFVVRILKKASKDYRV